MQLPLNALRMFDAAARHLSLTRAAQELHVTQAAVSQHIRNLEERLGKPLFRRLPRGLVLTDEGQALWPVVAQSFERIEQSLQQVAEPRPREILSVGVVGTFAIGWLICGLFWLRVRVSLARAERKIKRLEHQIAPVSPAAVDAGVPAVKE
mgnify:CR=1 FL=1